MESKRMNHSLLYAPSIEIALKLDFDISTDLAVERLEREMSFSWTLHLPYRCGAYISFAAAVKLSKGEDYGCYANCVSQQSQTKDENCESAEAVYLHRSSP
jgi:hypothetical protein